MDVILGGAYFFFLLSSFFAGLYFFVRRRDIDLLLVYFLSMVLYFLPLFFVSVYEPVSKSYITPHYMIFIVAGVACLGTLVAAGTKELLAKPVSVDISVTPMVGCIFNRLLLIICLALFFSIFGELSSAKSKSEMLEGGGFQLMLLSSLVPVGVISSYSRPDYALTVIFSLLCLVLFFFGSRSVLVFAFLAFFVFFSAGRPVVLIAKFRIMLILASSLFFVVIGKTFYGAVMAGGLTGIIDWYQTLDIKKLWHGAEFLATGGILNEVLMARFSIAASVVPLSLLAGLPLPTAWFGFSSSVFNDLFQPQLFPSIDYGMAYNPWAEAYSWLGLAGVVLYAICIPFTILCFEKAARLNGGNPMGAIFLIMGVTVAFWIHRNSVGSELAYLRNIFYPGLVLFLVALLSYTLLTHKRGFNVRFRRGL